MVLKSINRKKHFFYKHNTKKHRYRTRKQTKNNRRTQKGGQSVSLYGPNGPTGLNMPNQLKKTQTNSLSTFLLNPISKIGHQKINTINNVHKYDSTYDCFKDLQKRFVKCYKKYKKDSVRKRECKSRLRIKSNECQNVTNKYAYSFGNNKPQSSLAKLRTECWKKNVDEKAKCFSIFHRNIGASSPGILGLNNPTRKCAKKFQKRIEFCQPSPEASKDLFIQDLSKYKLFVSKNKIIPIDNTIISNLNKS